MIKVFLRLWILIFIPLFYLAFSSSYNPIKAINNWALHERVSETFKGTFYLIEKQLSEIPETQWVNQVAKIAEHFNYELRLISANDTIDGDSEIELSTLGNNDYIIFSDSNESDIVLKRVPNSDWFVYMMLDESEDQETFNQASGTFNLLLSQFESTEPTEWPTIINQMQPHFGFNLSLNTLEELSLPLAKFKQLETIGKTWITDENQQTLLYQQLPNSQQILRAGPIPLPGEVLSISIILISIFVLGISLGILLFVAPLWRDLSKLTKTAIQFGSGHLSQRAKINKRSVVARLAHSFNEMASQIESMVKGQRELTNAIAHDLRTPLSRVSFAFEMLQSDEVSDEEKQRYEAAIASGIDTLDHLIQQILALSRYSRATDITHFGQCVLAHRIREEINQHQIECADLVFELGIEPQLSDTALFVDQRAMLRALNNLLSNAIRYAQHTIRVSLALKEGHYMLSVEDDGEGIAIDDRERVFLPFKQLNNDQREITKEHGLGLAIVQQIAEWHHGGATLDESPLGGARFIIRWPADQKPPSLN